MASHYARRSGEDADDLLQEAWLGLFEAVPEVDLAIGQPEQFLLQRARWRLLSAIRHARLRRTSPIEQAAEPEAPFTEVPTADFTARLGETQRALATCLLAGMTFREAGEALGCTSANVAYHARRLRDAFVEWEGGTPLADSLPPAIPDSPARRAFARGPRAQPPARAARGRTRSSGRMSQVGSGTLSIS
jgi:RNA polymerase sigma-70 factor (ECF subfamily)